MAIEPSRAHAGREWAAILVCTVIGAVVRLWNVHRLGLNHFDEGIYALSGYWGVSPHGLADLSPQVIPYAPPGLTVLIGLSYALLGISDTAAILPALLCGVTTIPVAGWLGRRTFGPGAGAGAAAFAALSGSHVAFSRMAMTDVPFLLPWLVAMGLGARFLERPGFGPAVALGIAVGLAQNVKYNGGLTGAIVALTALLGLFVSSENRRPPALARIFGWGLLAALIAIGSYLPWFQFVEGQGGYSRLLEHHRGYLRGIDAWPLYWWAQMNQAVALSGRVLGNVTWGAFAWPLAWLGCGLAVLGPTSTRPRTRWSGAQFRIGLLLGAVVLGALPNLGWWMGLVLAPGLLFHHRPACRLLAVWWIVMAILTPFYHPYARLWLPLTAAGWLFLAGCVPQTEPFGGLPVVWPTADALPRWFRGRIRIPVALLLLALAVGIQYGSGRVPRPIPNLLEPSDSLRQAVLVDYPRNRPPLRPGTKVYALAAPPIRYYFSRLGYTVQALDPSGLSLALSRAQPGEIVVLDRVSYEALRVIYPVSAALAIDYQLSSLTLLDTDPEGVVFGGDPLRGSSVYVWVLAQGPPPIETF